MAGVQRSTFSSLSPICIIACDQRSTTKHEYKHVTIITLLRYSDRSSLNRPVGVGAYGDEDFRTHYNLSVDGSIRRDNGFTAGTEPTPEDFFIRGSVLSGDGVDIATIRDFYFDDYGSGFEALLNMDDEDFAAFETGNDRLYIGDLRSNYAENAIAQVAFYNAALSDEQVESIAEWIAENPNGTAEGGQPALMAGDANMDYEFNQLDLVQVQIAAKYLSGTAATWGEGDWDGAPGGQPGSPPAGDGEFSQLDIISALAAGTYLTGPYAVVRPGGWANTWHSSHRTDRFCLSSATARPIIRRSVKTYPMAWHNVSPWWTEAVIRTFTFR